MLMRQQLAEAKALARSQATELAAVRRDNSLLVEANRKLKIELGQR